MLQAGDATLAAAVAAPDRYVFVRLMVDWARDGRFAHAYSDLSSLIVTPTTNRSLSTDLPEAVNLVAGSSSGAVTLVLEGQRADDTMGIGEALSPWRSDSPLAGLTANGTPCTLDVLIDGTAVRQLTGTIRSTAVTGALSVTLTLADTVESVRRPVTLPAWARSAKMVGRFGDGQVWLTNTQWVLDFILRRNGIYQSPAAPPRAVISATLHGSYVPEVGVLRPSRGLVGVVDDIGQGRAYPTQPWVAGRYGLAQGGTVTSPTSARLSANPTAVLARADGVTTARCWAWSAWIFLDPALVTDTGYLRIATITMSDTTQNVVIGLRANALDVSVNGTSTGATGPTPSLTGVAKGWHHVTLWSYRPTGSADSTGSVMRIYLDGAPLGSDATASGTTSPIGMFGAATVTLNDYVPMQCVSVTSLNDNETPTTTNIPRDPPAPGPTRAFLDAGKNNLTRLPVVVGADSWDTLKDVVAAELGALTIDEDGSVRFRNRDTLAALATGNPTETITADTNLADIGSTTSIDTVRNYVRYFPATGVQESYGEWAKESWGSGSIEVPAGATVTRTIPVPPECAEPSTQAIFAQPGSFFGKDGDLDTNVIGVRSADGNHPDINDTSISDPYAGLSNAYLTINRGQRPTVTLTLVGKTNKPTAEVAYRFVGATTTVADPALAGGYNPPADRVLEPATTDWHNDIPSVANTAAALVDTLGRSQAVVGSLTVRGDPRRQLGDLVLVQDPDGLGSFRATVRDITRAVTADGGLVDTLAVRPA